MRNHIPKIKALHKAIESALFHIGPQLPYSKVTQALDLLARLVHDYPDDSSDLWAIGEFSSASLDSLIVGAYWHFSQWHNGQGSPEYRALSSLGQVFKPGCTSAPSRGENEYDVFQALDAMARRAQGRPVYRFCPITLNQGA